MDRGILLRARLDDPNQGTVFLRYDAYFGCCQLGLSTIMPEESVLPVFSV